ncbi:hypothetical protein GGR57DRAFT_442118 [Xylariaceae sp. FL1272]|nr:hypothetical protein GGR57DRAFT_442118 [Xylariaceae sp. FL1272]
MKLPNRSPEGSSEVSVENNELRWTVDTLQTFCRAQLPSEGVRDLSFSFGINRDPWMFLSFTFVGIKPVGKKPEPWEDDDINAASGITCDRREFQDLVFGHYREFRLSIITRICAGHDREKITPANPQPFVVCVILADEGQCKFRPDHDLSQKLRRPRTKEDEVDGIVIFQFLLVDLVDKLVSSWEECVEKVEQSFEGRLIVEHFHKLLEQPDYVANMKATDRHSRLGMLCNMTLFLDTLEKYISVGSQCFRRMIQTWGRIYHAPPGLDREIGKENTRFTEVGLKALANNWNEIVWYTECLEERFLNRL